MVNVFFNGQQKGLNLIKDIVPHLFYNLDLYRMRVTHLKLTLVRKEGIVVLTKMRYDVPILQPTQCYSFS